MYRKRYRVAKLHMTISMFVRLNGEDHYIQCIVCGLCACEKKHYSRTHKSVVKWSDERERAKRKYCGNEAASKYWLSKRLATQSISTLDGDSQIVARAFTIIATYLVSQALLDGTRCAGLGWAAKQCYAVRLGLLPRLFSGTLYLCCVFCLSIVWSFQK